VKFPQRTTCLARNRAVPGQSGPLKPEDQTATTILFLSPHVNWPAHNLARLAACQPVEFVLAVEEGHRHFEVPVVARRDYAYVSFGILFRSPAVGPCPGRPGMDASRNTGFSQNSDWTRRLADLQRGRIPFEIVLRFCSHKHSLRR